MTRVAVLRSGYGAVALSFLVLAGSSLAGALLPLGLALAFVGAALLAWSDDDLPKWAGLTLLAYFLVTVLAFVASTPITIRKGGSFYIEAPSPDLAKAIFEYLVLALPLMMAGAGLAAVWEREAQPRFLLAGAGAGIVLTAILTFVLTPRGTDVQSITSSARTQASILTALFAVAALSGSAGLAWAATRPEETG